MTSWDFSGMDFDDIANLPSWAFENLPLNKNSEFILEAPEEGKEPIVSNKMYEADDEHSDEDDDEVDTCIMIIDRFDREITQLRQLLSRMKEYPTIEWYECSTRLFGAWVAALYMLIKELEKEQRSWGFFTSRQFDAGVATLNMNIKQIVEEHQRQQEEREEIQRRQVQKETQRLRRELEERQRRENSQARDNETPNSLSKCPDFSPKYAQIFLKTRRQNRQDKISISLPSHPDILNILDYEQIKGFETMDIELVPNALENFESMDIQELQLDYQVALPFNPTQIFSCDLQKPDVFDLNTHWFHDTLKAKCYCHHCAQHRRLRSRGQQLEAHDFNEWCHCTACLQFWHDHLDPDFWCNCPKCVEADALKDEGALTGLEDEFFIKQIEELNSLQNEQQSPLPSPSAEQEQGQKSQDQQLPSGPLCSDSIPNTIVGKFKDLRANSSKQFNIVRGNLQVDSDSDFDTVSISSFDFDADIDSSSL